jgi:K+-sensing histidine kinase KdpD
MLGDELVGGLKERRLRMDRGVPPFQLIDELAHRNMLPRRRRPKNFS